MFKFITIITFDSTLTSFTIFQSRKDKKGGRHIYRSNPIPNVK